MNVYYVVVRKDKYRSSQFTYYDKIPFFDPEGNCNFLSNEHDKLFTTFVSLKEASNYSITLPYDCFICSYVVGDVYALVENITYTKN